MSCRAWVFTQAGAFLWRPCFVHSGLYLANRPEKNKDRLNQGHVAAIPPGVTHPACMATQFRAFITEYDMPALTPDTSVDSIRLWATPTWATGCSARGARCFACRFRRSAAEIASPPPRSQEGPKRRRRRHNRQAAPLCSVSVANLEIHHNAPDLPARAGWRHLHEGPVLRPHNEVLVPQMQRR